MGGHWGSPREGGLREAAPVRVRSRRDGDKRERPAWAHARTDEHDCSDAEGDADRPRRRVAREAPGRVHRDLPHLVTRRPRDTERGRDLLQRDDDGDPRRESFDDGHRQVADVAAEPSERQDDENHAGHGADHEHAAGPEARHDGQEHDGHRAGRPGHLEIRPTEDGGDRARHDGCGKTGLRPKT